MPRMTLGWVASLLAVLAGSAGAEDCWAWGATGREWASGIAIEKLPDSVPGFVRTPKAAAEIAVMGHELDCLRGASRLREMDERHKAAAGSGEASRWQDRP